MNSRKELNQLLSTTLIVVFALAFTTVIRHLVNKLMFQLTNEQSDVFNGIMTPLLSLVGSLLVYSALQVQQDTNLREKGKLEREKALQSIEAATRAAGAELKAQLETIKQCVKSVARYEDELEEKQALYDVDPLIYKQQTDSNIKRLDNELVIAAGLLNIAYELIEEDSLTVQDKSYCLVLFENECMKMLPDMFPTRRVNTLLDQSLVANTNYILWLKSTFTTKRLSYYTKIMADSNHDLKSPWRSE